MEGFNDTKLEKVFWILEYFLGSQVGGEGGG